MSRISQRDHTLMENVHPILRLPTPQKFPGTYRVFGPSILSVNRHIRLRGSHCMGLRVSSNEGLALFGKMDGTADDLL